MENALAKYYQREELAQKVVKSCRIVQGTARDSGNVYYAIEIEFVNGYKKRLFPQEAERFAIVNAFELVETTKQVDSNLI